MGIFSLKRGIILVETLMFIRFLTLSSLFLSLFTAVKAEYQELTFPGTTNYQQPNNSYKNQVQKSSGFKLGVQEEELSYTPSNVGIVGIKYLHKPGSMSTVIEVYPRTPAAAAGIRVGDRLLEVNGTNIIPFSSDQVFSMIAGYPGAPINLKFMRCNAYGMNCYSFTSQLVRMDMNKLESDRIFRIYKYGS